MIFLDTHIVMWLYNGERGRFTARGVDALQRTAAFISPMVKLELHYLDQIGKLTVKPDTIISGAAEWVKLSLTDSSFADICRQAEKLTWTRDTFDRLIVAEASLHKAPLISADRIIRKHYAKVIW